MIRIEHIQKIKFDIFSIDIFNYNNEPMCILESFDLFNILNVEISQNTIKYIDYISQHLYKHQLFNSIRLSNYDQDIYQMIFYIWKTNNRKYILKNLFEEIYENEIFDKIRNKHVCHIYILFHILLNMNKEPYFPLTEEQIHQKKAILDLYNIRFDDDCLKDPKLINKKLNEYKSIILNILDINADLRNEINELKNEIYQMKKLSIDQNNFK